HDLARRYHPDRFHRSEPQLRAQLDSAFARIAQAYETLTSGAMRAAYDAKLKPKGATERSANRTTEKKAAKSENAETQPSVSDAERAEARFQQGLAALEKNQREPAIRCLAEAAMLQPRRARYRAEYGHALIGEANARRVAESELQAAISLEPEN